MTFLKSRISASLLWLRSFSLELLVAILNGKSSSPNSSITKGSSSPSCFVSTSFFNPSSAWIAPYKAIRSSLLKEIPFIGSSAFHFLISYSGLPSPQSIRFNSIETFFHFFIVPICLIILIATKISNKIQKSFRLSSESSSTSFLFSSPIESII